MKPARSTNFGVVRRSALGLLSFLVLIGLGLWLLRSVPTRTIVLDILTLVESAGAWGLLALLAAYGVASMFLLPVFILNLGVGFLYGIGCGFAVSLTGVILGAGLTFLLGWVVLARTGRPRLLRGPRWDRTFDAVDSGGLKLLILVRASPAVPNAWLNYLVPLTRIPWWKNALAVAIGRTPLTLLDVYIGSLARSLADAVAGGSGIGWLEIVVLVVGASLSIAVLVCATRITRRALSVDPSAASSSSLRR